jgi:hypothetical protein
MFTSLIWENPNIEKKIYAYLYGVLAGTTKMNLKCETLN